ncbi:MAG: 2-C-methyl-D-erythritol 4-phosphate cytidylyltransferase [Candidatus Gastranaerophilales bacterium]|nr:2-C-methyl-D-erythritol 4-phosphate cytidylyltransferase [Candidatus Gastranaerophilales bacterium]
MKNYAVILASGRGSRSGLDIPKQFYKISGKTLLEYSVEAFESNKNIDSIIIVTNPDFMDLTKKIIRENNYKKIIKILSGGSKRQESSFIGISAIEEENANVLIHDAVRPFISQEIINNCITALKTYKAVNVAIETSDTIVETDENNIIKNVPDRKFLRRCQTPQCFDLKTIKKAHLLAKNDIDFSATDDCSIVLRYNLSEVYVIKGDDFNIKITYPLDLEIAEKILNLKKD